MKKLQLIRITGVMLCSLFFAMVLTSSVFAFIVKNDQDPRLTDVWASVYIDRYEYDSTGEGVVYLDGSFGLYNINEHRGCTYTFEVRLEIFKLNKEDGKYYTLTPDAKTDPLIKGSLDEAAEPWENFDATGSDSVNLHIPCLSGGKHKAGDVFQARATVTLNVTQNGWKDPWQITEHELNFTHRPQGQIGIGATKDGEFFSGKCKVTDREGWQSLIKTDAPYAEIYWYVKAPGDTSAFGEHLERKNSIGDGDKRDATMTHIFPNDVPGDWAYYTITAYVYRWDLSVYWDSYKVEVYDAN